MVLSYAQQVLSDTIFLHECARNECRIAKEIPKRGFLQDRGVRKFTEKLQQTYSSLRTCI